VFVCVSVCVFIYTTRSLCDTASVTALRFGVVDDNLCMYEYVYLRVGARMCVDVCVCVCIHIHHTQLAYCGGDCVTALHFGVVDDNLCMYGYVYVGVRVWMCVYVCVSVCIQILHTQLA